MVAARRHIHQHPELSGCEQETADYICQILDEFQIPYRKNVAGSGVVPQLLKLKQISLSNISLASLGFAIILNPIISSILPRSV